MLIKRRFPLAGFIILTVTLIGFCAFSLLRAEVQRQEAGFAEYVQNISGIVRNQLDTNDAVLAGFSAFLQAVDQSDTESAARYAAAVSSAYPHIYMLEVARAVPISEQTSFQALLQRTWNPHFELKNFPSLTQQSVQLQIHLKETWPVLFMYPPLPKASAIYGVRLETVPYLSYALAKSRESARPVASPVFSMYEGGHAYILLRSVTRDDQEERHARPNFFGSSMVALVLIKTDSLLDAVMRDNVDPLVGVTALLRTETDAQSTLFSVNAREAGWLSQMLLPRLDERVHIKSTSQPTTLLFDRQLRLADVLNPETLTVLSVLLAGIVLIPLVLYKHFSAIERAQIEHERSAYLATHDVLTDLPNRYLLTQRFELALVKWHGDRMPFAVFLIDLDHFKQINDDHGHAVGDQVLQTIAARMLQATRLYETVVARYGGDEFVALVSDVASLDSVQPIAQRLLQVIEQPISTSAGRLSLSCSIGVSLCPIHGEDLDTLLKAADEAMYEVKQVGKNGVAMAEFLQEEKLRN